MAAFRCVVCTPTEKLFDGDVYYASVPSEEGMFGVMAGHETLCSLVGRGGICYVNLDEAGTQKQEFLLYKGGTQMLNGILTVLGSFGIDPADINRTKVESHANNMRFIIEGLEGKEDYQSKAKRAIFKRRLEWDEFQLEYLDKQGA